VNTNARRSTLEKERPYRALACEVISYSQMAQAALVSLLHSAILQMLCIHHINSNSEASVVL